MAAWRRMWITMPIWNPIPMSMQAPICIPVQKGTGRGLLIGNWDELGKFFPLPLVMLRKWSPNEFQDDSWGANNVHVNGGVSVLYSVVTENICESAVLNTLPILAALGSHSVTSTWGACVRYDVGKAQVSIPWKVFSLPTSYFTKSENLAVWEVASINIFKHASEPSLHSTQRILKSDVLTSAPN